MKTKRYLFLIPLLVLFLVPAGCNSKPPKQTSQAPAQPGTPPGAMPGSPHGNMPQAAKSVDLPDSIKSAWKAVNIEILNKDTKEKKQYEIPTNSEMEIPGTDLSISVGDFFPAFSMDGNRLTSSSKEATNPATNVEVKQKGSTIFKGWLFSKFPGVHPFENDKYGITLVGGVPSK